MNFSVCINGKFQCTGEPCPELECDDNELKCSPANKKSEFICLPQSFLCDGTVDCIEGEDELNCSKYECVKFH